jgi:hypothetical protein
VAHDEIADLRDRLVEQLSSDERLLGTLPEEASRLVLNDAISRLDAAAAGAASSEALSARADVIRSEARALVDRAAGAADPEAFVRGALHRDEAAPAGATPAAVPAPPDASAARSSRRGRRGWAWLRRWW